MRGRHVQSCVFNGLRYGASMKTALGVKPADAPRALRRVSRTPTPECRCPRRDRSRPASEVALPDCTWVRYFDDASASLCGPCATGERVRTVVSASATAAGRLRVTCSTSPSGPPNGSLAMSGPGGTPRIERVLIPVAAMDLRKWRRFMMVRSRWR